MWKSPVLIKTQTCNQICKWNPHDIHVNVSRFTKQRPFIYYTVILRSFVTNRPVPERAVSTVSLHLPLESHNKAADYLRNPHQMGKTEEKSEVTPLPQLCPQLLKKKQESGIRSSSDVQVAH